MSRPISTIVLYALIGSGCFHVTPGDGEYVCDPGICHSGYYCADDHRCWHDGHAPPDASVGMPTDASDPTPSMDGPDLSSPPGPPAATPRPIAPQSAGTVTQQQPTLRWTIGTGAVGKVEVDLCADHACNKRLAVAATVDSSGTTARPQAPLSPGVVFWRVRNTVAGMSATSVTWPFWVGHKSASTAVDTTSGTTLDIDGNGRADIVVGVHLFGDRQGMVHVYLGGRQIDVHSPDGPGAQFGYSVANAGDVNGDGYADFLVGANADDGGKGITHLYLGSPNPSESDWNGVTARNRVDLPSSDGEGAFFQFGFGTAGIGDVNGDGFADFAVGGWGSQASAVHVYLGNASPSSEGWNGVAAPQRIDVFRPSAASYFGSAVAGAGDVDGDGYSDFLIGAYGAAYLYRGSATAQASDWNGSNASGRFDLSNPDAGANVFGGAVGSAGDVNGDGYTDFLVSGPCTPYAAHLFLGGASLRTSDWNGSKPPKRFDIIDPAGTVSPSGGGVTPAGDVDGDGYDDFLVGEYSLSSNKGTAHLFRGSPTPQASDWNGATAPGRIDLADPDPNANFFGHSRASAGDVDGDGYADFLVSSYDRYVRLYRGSAVPSASDWNATVSTTRDDFLNSDGSGSAFGFSVARADHVHMGSRSNGRGASWMMAGRRRHVFSPSTQLFRRIADECACSDHQTLATASAVGCGRRPSSCCTPRAAPPVTPSSIVPTTSSAAPAR